MATITTIITTYRRPAMLHRAIQSVLNQTYKDLEVLVCDDASGDETGDVVQEAMHCDPRVKYFCHPQNIGMNRNWVFGTTRVTTPFFTFLSDDDILLPEFFETAINALEKWPDSMLFVGLTLHADPCSSRVLGATVSSWRPGLYLPPEACLAMLNNGHASWTSMVFKRDVLGTVGSLDERVGLPADLDFQLRVAARYPAVVENKPCAVFLCHPWSVDKGPYSGFSDGFVRIMKKFEDDRRLDSEARKSIHAAMLAYFGRDIFSHALRPASHKRTVEALHAARLLEEHFERRTLARFVRLMACDRVLGVIPRVGFKTLAPVRRRLLAILNHQRFSKYQRAIRYQLDDLERSTRENVLAVRPHPAGA